MKSEPTAQVDARRTFQKLKYLLEKINREVILFSEITPSKILNPLKSLLSPLRFGYCLLYLFFWIS